MLMGRLRARCTSSLGCAICDLVIALWCFAGGKMPGELLGWGSRLGWSAGAGAGRMTGLLG
ncbi:DUF6010 family protein [Streptomyces cyaneus]|uniref:DUF6010 family protein n=1 Tax=Streptomyces cyaneus TaxID=1904 RepID=UPI001C65D59A